MKLRKLTATFGCLDGATLTFGPGLTLIGAPTAAVSPPGAPSSG